MKYEPNCNHMITSYVKLSFHDTHGLALKVNIFSTIFNIKTMILLKYISTLKIWRWYSLVSRPFTFAFILGQGRRKSLETLDAVSRVIGMFTINPYVTWFYHASAALLWLHLCLVSLLSAKCKIKEDCREHHIVL